MHLKDTGTVAIKNAVTGLFTVSQYNGCIKNSTGVVDSSCLVVQNDISFASTFTTTTTTAAPGI